MPFECGAVYGGLYIYVCVCVCYRDVVTCLGTAWQDGGRCLTISKYGIACISKMDVPYKEIMYVRRFLLAG